MTHDLLATIPLFSKLQPQERAELAGMLKAQEFPPHRPIFWLGEKGESFYIIEHGKVIVSCPDEAGKEVILGHLTSGQFFGEISLLDGGPRTATVRTASDTVKLCTLSREDFMEFLRRHPDAAIYMLGILGKRQRETNEKIRGIRNVNEAVAEKRTRWHVVAERIALISANVWFVTFNLVFVGAWVCGNLLLRHWGRHPFDEPPVFGTLDSILTVEALFVSLFVLISQGQQGERDRVRADMDYQVNLKAHQEVMQLHQKLDRLHRVVERLEDAQPASEPNEASVRAGV